MQKGPLVYSALILAAMLMVMSFALIAFPDHVETIGIVSAVVAVAVIIVLVLMLIRTRRSV